MNRLKKKFISRSKIPIYIGKKLKYNAFMVNKIHDPYTGKYITTKFILGLVDDNDFLTHLFRSSTLYTWYDKNGKIYRE
jgi:hypothetical protein